jgi:hypothetical protein
LTECGDLSEAEAEETETAIVAVKMAVAALTAKSAAVTKAETAVYQRGCWFVSSISDVRIMWNITMHSPSSLRTNH